jgi:hypothetical protein
MDRRKPGVDIIADILQAAVATFPNSPFCASLLQQYGDRGFLTKKQLEGLHNRASKIIALPPGTLATLEAIILKMPTRVKSQIPEVSAPLYEKNIPIHLVISSILEKYPSHKQVLMFKAKNAANMPLSTSEINDLERFYSVLIAKKG